MFQSASIVAAISKRYQLDKHRVHVRWVWFRVVTDGYASGILLVAVPSGGLRSTWRHMGRYDLFLVSTLCKLDNKGIDSKIWWDRRLPKSSATVFGVGAGRQGAVGSVEHCQFHLEFENIHSVTA